MPSLKKKPTPPVRAVVDVVTDPKSGISVNIYFARETGLFEAESPQDKGLTLRNELVSELKTRLQAMLSSMRSFDWKPVIVVSCGGGASAYNTNMNGTQYKLKTSRLDLKFRRCDLAPKPGDTSKFLERLHELDVPEDEREPALKSRFDHKEPNAGMRRAQNKDTNSHHLDDGDHVLPYTEATWANLHRIRSAIAALQVQVDGLFASPDLLEGFAMRLLAPASTEASVDVDDE